MKTTQAENEQITAAVDAFMGERKTCYAIPGTDNHSSNYYGDETICEFTAAELEGLIQGAIYDWRDENNDRLAVGDVIDEIIGDMQTDRP